MVLIYYERVHVCVCSADRLFPLEFDLYAIANRQSFTDSCCDALYHWLSVQINDCIFGRCHSTQIITIIMVIAGRDRFPMWTRIAVFSDQSIFFLQVSCFILLLILLFFFANIIDYTCETNRPRSVLTSFLKREK
jgi:hypothetical protein